jgi:hypothetical protein
VGSTVGFGVEYGAVYSETCGSHESRKRKRPTSIKKTTPKRAVVTLLQVMADAAVIVNRRAAKSQASVSRTHRERLTARRVVVKVELGRACDSESDAFV